MPNPLVRPSIGLPSSVALSGPHVAPPPSFFPQPPSAIAPQSSATIDMVLVMARTLARACSLDQAGRGRRRVRVVLARHAAGEERLAPRVDGEPHRLRHQHRLLRRRDRSEEHTSELQSRLHLVCRLLLEKKKKPPSL